MIEKPPQLWLPPKPAIIRAWNSEDIKRPRATFPFPFFVPSAEGPPPANAWIGASNSTADLTTYTFSNVSLGTPHSTRYIIVGVVTISSSNRTISSASIGGIGATISSNASGTYRGSMIIAAVPTGATGNVVITHSGGCTSCAIGVWAAYDIGSTTAHSAVTAVSSGGTFSISVNVKANQTIRYACLQQNGVGGTGATGMTNRARANSESFFDYRFLDYKATSAESPHAASFDDTGSSLNAAGCGVSY